MEGLPGFEGDSAVKSAARALDLLEFVVRASRPPTFASLAASLQIPKSSLSNLLATLIDRGYVVRESGVYRPGSGIERLTQAFWQTAGIASRVHSLLRDMRQQLDETTGYSERRDDDAEVVATDAGRRALVYTLRVGARVALHRVSTGKILLAACDDEAVEAYADRADLTARSPFGINSPAALYRDIEQIRKTGFARSRGEVVEDIVGIATALKISGAVVGALCVVLPASRYDAARDADITRVLAAAAARFHP